MARSRTNSSGSRKSVVEVYANAGGTNDYGDPVEDWSLHATIYAQPMTTRAREILNASSEVSAVKRVYLTVYDPTITDEMRLKELDREYEIHAVDHDQAIDETRITCEWVKDGLRLS